jgi:hypothetical protein
MAFMPCHNALYCRERQEPKIYIRATPFPLPRLLSEKESETREGKEGLDLVPELHETQARCLSGTLRACVANSVCVVGI